MPITYELKRPIEVGEEKLTALNLREPTVKEIAELGYPFRPIQTDSGSTVEMLPGVMLRYVSKLAGVPPSSLDGLAVSDLMGLHGEIMSFFTD